MIYTTYQPIINLLPNIKISIIPITNLMIEIKKGSLEERALQILFNKYPITVDELRQELGISKGAVERLVKKLVSRGIISLEELPSKSYIRLQRRDFRFIGRHESQRRPLKHKTRRDRTAKYKPKKEKDDYDDMMYHWKLENI